MVSKALQSSSTDALFAPFSIGPLNLRNRIVMAPMTRAFAEDGVPDERFAAYYARRAEGEVGLIVTQGTWVPHPTASHNPSVPRFYGDDALEGWRRVAEAVHAAGGRIVPQLWHIGLVVGQDGELVPGTGGGPSGIGPTGAQLAEPMTLADIDAVIDAFATAAASAQRIGFDGVELHGAHGYLIDQFLWGTTNRRTDRYGGSFADRARLGVEIVEEIRRRVGTSFPIIFRFSQWKGYDFDAKLGDNPAELAQLLDPLTAAGVDVYHCSQRRFWEPAFAGSDLNLAGWTKQLTGKPTITVGSVSLNGVFERGVGAELAGIDELLERLERGEFDLVALGRSLLANPSWPKLVREELHDELLPYNPSVLEALS